MKQTLLILLAIFLFLNSCGSDTVAGGSTTVENGFVMVTVAFNSEPVVASVQLIPSNYNPITEENGPIRKVQTDNEGTARFDVVPNGSYAVLVMEDTIGRYESSIPLNATIDLELEKTGTVTINADSVESLGLAGTPFSGTVDNSTGTVTFTIPPGDYVGVVTDSVENSTSITIEPEKEVVISVEQTKFSVTPIDLGSQLPNWSISDLATGSVNTLWVATEDGGLHYFNGTEWLFIGALEGIPSNQVINGVAASGAVPAGESSERVIVHGEQIYMLKDNTWYELSTGNPQFLGKTVVASSMNANGFSVIALNETVHYNTDFEGGWYEVPLAGVTSLYCGIDTIWASTGQELCAIEINSKSSTMIASGFGSINAIDYKDHIILATDSGLVEQISSEWIIREGSPKNLNHLAVDSSGNVWAVQENRGIVKFHSSDISTYRNETLARSVTAITGRGTSISVGLGAEGIVSIE